MDNVFEKADALNKRVGQELHHAQGALSAGENSRAVTGYVARDGEAAELARQLGAVAKECDVIVAYVLRFKNAPPKVTASAERLDAWLAEVRPHSARLTCGDESERGTNEK